MQHCPADLKKKLRQLKKLEHKIRFQHRPMRAGQRLIWNEFFSTKAWDADVKYPLYELAKADRGRRKEIYDEYFARVYFQHYQENGLTLTGLYDPVLLSMLGLSPYADVQDIKRKFRELAKKFHPDRGGDSASFIWLMEIYERLLGD